VKNASAVVAAGCTFVQLCAASCLPLIGRYFGMFALSCSVLLAVTVAAPMVYLGSMAVDP